MQNQTEDKKEHPQQKTPNPMEDLVHSIGALEGKDFYEKFGVGAVLMLRTGAKMPTAKPSMVEDWETIKLWLGIQSGELNQQHLKKIGAAWTTYLHGGKSPSLELEPIFSDLKSKQSSNQNMPPKEIILVFDRLLATDKQIGARKSLYQSADNFSPDYSSRKEAKIIVLLVLITLLVILLMSIND